MPNTVMHHFRINDTNIELQDSGARTEITNLKGSLSESLGNQCLFGYTDGYYIKATGDTATNAESCITDYIDVIPGTKLKLSGLYVAGSRAACAYDANKNFVASIISGSASTTTDYTVPSGVYYIRATGYAGTSPSVKIVDICENVTDLIKEMSDISSELNEVSGEVDVIKGVINSNFVFTYMDGYYIKATGDTATNNESGITDYIAVVPGQKIKLSNIYVAGLRAVCAYDDDKNFKASIISGSSSTEKEYEVPNGVYYIRATGYAGTPPDVFINDICGTIKDIQGEINQIDPIKNALGDYQITPSVVTGKYINATDGTEKTAPASADPSCVTDFIPVLPGQTVYAEKLFLIGVRAICAYDSNKLYLETIAGGSSATSTEYDVPNGCAYIRATGAGSTPPVISYNNLVDVVFQLSENIPDAQTDYNFGTDFVNNFIPSSELSLPSYYSDFPIDITVSRYGILYGHNLVPSEFIKNNASGATYYVSPDGNDSNTGTSPSTPLKSIDTAVSKSDVNTIILLSGNYENGVHFSSAISKEINIIGSGQVMLISKNTDEPMKFTKGCYVENIVFYGGTSACKTELGTDLCVFNGCVFTKSGSQDGLSALGGYYVLFDCIADDNMLDGFNYHANSSYKPQVIEIGCKGKLNGHRSNLTQNNGSTIHDTNSRIIRIGCEYASSRGGVVADANNAFSVNIACKSSSTEAISETNRNANYVVMGNAMMWLYDCSSYGSPYDLIADTGYIYTTKTYQRESAVNNGVINRLT